MEASIMNGANLDVGAVTLVKEFSNPISIAHKVLTDSPHSLLGGEGAKLFALDKVSSFLCRSRYVTLIYREYWCEIGWK